MSSEMTEIDRLQATIDEVQAELDALKDDKYDININKYRCSDAAATLVYCFDFNKMNAAVPPFVFISWGELCTFLEDLSRRGMDAVDDQIEADKEQ